MDPLVVVISRRKARRSIFMVLASSSKPILASSSPVPPAKASKNLARSSWQKFSGPAIGSWKNTGRVLLTSSSACSYLERACSTYALMAASGEEDFFKMGRGSHKFLALFWRN
eukprot:GHVS01087658.1.p2 GENE.GHVS01087658.1~~GHVS01087658.1.p2  ORF type:complete len:113 (-),score=8.68 GHVS01087658.1:315-653(-)